MVADDALGWSCAGHCFGKWACSAHTIASIHVDLLPLTPSLTQTHTLKRSYSSNELLHTHTHAIRPWLATSGPQVTDVCMRQGDSNEYWITAVMQYPILTHNVSHFCPLAFFQDFRVKPTLFFQIDPFGPPGTPNLLSSRDFPFLTVVRW